MNHSDSEFYREQIQSLTAMAMAQQKKLDFLMERGSNSNSKDDAGAGAGAEMGEAEAEAEAKEGIETTPVSQPCAEAHRLPTLPSADKKDSAAAACKPAVLDATDPGELSKLVAAAIKEVAAAAPPAPPAETPVCPSQTSTAATTTTTTTTTTAPSSSSSSSSSGHKRARPPCTAASPMPSPLPGLDLGLLGLPDDVLQAGLFDESESGSPAAQPIRRPNKKRRGSFIPKPGSRRDVSDIALPSPAAAAAAAAAADEGEAQTPQSTREPERPRVGRPRRFSVTPQQENSDPNREDGPSGFSGKGCRHASKPEGRSMLSKVSKGFGAFAKKLTSGHGADNTQSPAQAQAQAQTQTPTDVQASLRGLGGVRRSTRRRSIAVVRDA
jgi:hypothetical protein